MAAHRREHVDAHAGDPAAARARGADRRSRRRRGGSRARARDHRARERGGARARHAECRRGHEGVGPKDDAHVHAARGGRGLRRAGGHLVGLDRQADRGSARRRERDLGRSSARAPRARARSAAGGGAPVQPGLPHRRGRHEVVLARDARPDDHVRSARRDVHRGVGRRHPGDRARADARRGARGRALELAQPRRHGARERRTGAAGHACDRARARAADGSDAPDGAAPERDPAGAERGRWRPRGARRMARPLRPRVADLRNHDRPGGDHGGELRRQPRRDPTVRDRAGWWPDLDLVRPRVRTPSPTRTSATSPG